MDRKKRMWKKVAIIEETRADSINVVTQSGSFSSASCWGGNDILSNKHKNMTTSRSGSTV